ncbi:hypothetical protein AAC387_Pa03g3051 [Persea americana]
MGRRVEEREGEGEKTVGREGFAIAVCEGGGGGREWEEEREKQWGEREEERVRRHWGGGRKRGREREKTMGREGGRWGGDGTAVICCRPEVKGEVATGRR